MILDFFKTAANLKMISRQGWIDKLSLNNPESVADHTYSMAIMSMVISDLQNYNSEKILKMVLLHDLAESKTGDITPEQIDKDKKKKHRVSRNIPKQLTLQIYCVLVPFLAC